MNDESTDILLVEDSEDDAVFFKHAMKLANPSARLRIARDGAEALEMIFGSTSSSEIKPVMSPKLIVLDLKLPKISGLEVLRRLKVNPNSQSLPVVVLSSSQEKRDLSDSYQLGANSYLVKPMDFDDFGGLVQIINRYWLQYNQTQ